MASKLIQMLDQFRGNRDRAAEEGRFGDELPTLYSNGVAKRIYDDLGDQNYNFKSGKSNEFTSYIGINGGECYLVTPIKTEISEKGNLSDQLGDFLLNVIEKGKMQIGNTACVQGTGALKKAGTCLGVDNSVQVAEKDCSLKAEIIEKQDPRFGNKYLIIKVNSPSYNALEVKNFLYSKLNQLQPRAFEGKAVNKVDKINSEELGYFLSN